ncbi:MAG: orotidine-5'-phosphate decarboxylase [Spirochaetes bacterium]|nr:orotidine-5'-phosphate decarboxylase [Spirochaetota bacterium]
MDKIIVALDFDTMDEVKAAVDKLGSDILWYKVGLQLFLAEGEKVLTYLASKNKKIFLDLKFFDIPNTVAGAVKNACRMGAQMTTLHAIGGSRMIEAAANIIAKEKSDMTLLAVTILTSTDETILVNDMGLASPIESQVVRLARMAANAGAGGMVCSPFEISAVRSVVGKRVIVTPGVRMSGESVHDQKRVKTPMEAINEGSDYIVMGRSITGSKDPSEVIRAVASGIHR